jgi:hypothetical protein
VTQNPWLKWLNIQFAQKYQTTHQGKYTLYSGWMINRDGITDYEALSAINNASMSASDYSLRSEAKIPSGGAEPVSSSLWYTTANTPKHISDLPFKLAGSNNEAPFYTSCVVKSNWNANNWFGRDYSFVQMTMLPFATYVCGNSVLISNFATLSTPNPGHPLGFQLRVFWDYDHETMVNGAYWDPAVGLFDYAGVWDRYIQQDLILTSGIDSTPYSGFVSGMNISSSSSVNTNHLVRDIYIQAARGYLLNNPTFSFTNNNPTAYNPLRLEPLFNVLERDLVRTNNEGFVVP